MPIALEASYKIIVRIILDGDDLETLAVSIRVHPVIFQSGYVHISDGVLAIGSRTLYDYEHQS